MDPHSLILLIPKIFFIVVVILTLLQLITGQVFTHGYGSISRRLNPGAYWFNLLGSSIFLLSLPCFMVYILENSIPNSTTSPVRSTFNGAYPLTNTADSMNPLIKSNFKVQHLLANNAPKSTNSAVKSKCKIVKLHGQWTIVKDPGYKPRHASKGRTSVRGNSRI